MSSSAAVPGGGAAETALVQQLRTGDPDAYESLVRQHAPALLATCRRILHNEDDARDALQDAFFAAHRSVGRFEGRARLGTWLHRIAVNACLMKLRSRRSRPEESIEPLLPRFIEDGHQVSHPPAWSERPDQLLQRQEERTRVRACVEALPESYRLVLVLRDVEELSTEETARLLGMTPGAVKTRLHRSRQALRSMFEARYASRPV